MAREGRTIGFSIRERVESFGHAFRGVATLLATQHNSWIHALAMVAAIALGLWLALAPAAWAAIVLAIVAVWVAEALNTALELLCDVASPDFHPLVKKAKDVAAAAVLVSAVGAAIVGFLILGPPLFARLFG